MHKKRYFNIAVHDVTASSIEQIEKIQSFLNALDIKKATYLIIPKYHDKESIHEIKDRLKILACGQEIALHGFTHKGKPTAPYSAMKLITDGEGEFISYADLKERLARGIGLLQEARIPPIGFIPPAWLIHKKDISVLYSYPFTFLNTRHFVYDLVNKKRYLAPVVTYSSRGLLQTLSIAVFKVHLALIEPCKLIRIAIHPKDIDMPKKMHILKDELIRLKKSRDEILFSEFIKQENPIENM